MPSLLIVEFTAQKAKRINALYGVCRTILVDTLKFVPTRRADCLWFFFQDITSPKPSATWLLHCTALQRSAIECHVVCELGVFGMLYMFLSSSGLFGQVPADVERHLHIRDGPRPLDGSHR